jgi:hypothetical protein
VSANVVVPAGGFCAFDGASVTGNVLVGPGAIADLAYVSIDGNVQSSGAALIFLKGFVTGNVAFNDGGAVSVAGDSFIGGNLRPIRRLARLRGTHRGKPRRSSESRAASQSVSNRLTAEG